MKKLVTIMIGVALSTACFAQFSKGTIMAGGSLSATFDTYKTEAGNVTTTIGTSSSFSVFPKAGYFVIDNLAVGAGIDLYTSTFKPQNSTNKSTSSSTSLAPFARYYYKKLYGEFAFNVGTGNNKTTSGATTTDNKYSTSGWRLAVGYAYLLNEHVAVEPQIGYASFSDKTKSSGNINSNAGLFINVGFQIYLSKLGK